MRTDHWSSIRRAVQATAVLAMAACGGGGGDKTPTSPGGTTAVLTSIGISGSTSSLTVGNTLQLSAAPKDQNGNAFTATVGWTSSNTTVATVSGAGLVTAVGAGSVVITASSGTVSATFQLTVTNPPPVLTTITVTGSANTLLPGGTLQLTAAAKDQFGSAFTTTVAWASSNTGVATVSSAGLVTAVAAGSTNITATSGGITGTFALTVTSTPVLTTITVTGSTTTLASGNTLQLFSAPKDQFGNAIAATVTWSSSNTAVATISGSGLVTAVGAGTTTLRATSGAVSGTYNLTVTSNTPVLTTITVTGASGNLNVGATRQLTAQGKDQFGANIAATFTWSSLSTAVATVNSSGLVTGVASGQTTIRATSGGVSGDFQITISAPFPSAATVSMPGQSFSPVQLDVAVGAVVTFEFPAEAHNVVFTGGSGSPAGIPTTSNQNVSRVFNTAGTFPYVCTLHAGMEATVIVH